MVSGYAGGHVKNPTYKEVCSGRTGHAEVAQLTFDPGLITYEELLEVFWKTHDPTTLNRQGGDVGTQYRSVIFYHNEAQKKLAVHYKSMLDASDVLAILLLQKSAPCRNFMRRKTIIRTISITIHHNHIARWSSG